MSGGESTVVGIDAVRDRVRRARAQGALDDMLEVAYETPDRTYTAREILMLIAAAREDLKALQRDREDELRRDPEVLREAEVQNALRGTSDALDELVRKKAAREGALLRARLQERSARYHEAAQSNHLKRTFERLVDPQAAERDLGIFEDHCRLRAHVERGDLTEEIANALHTYYRLEKCGSLDDAMRGRLGRVLPRPANLPALRDALAPAAPTVAPRAAARRAEEPTRVRRPRRPKHSMAELRAQLLARRAAKTKDLPARQE